MITVIRDLLLSLSYYWKKTVMGRLGLSCQNDGFIGMIRSNSRFVLTEINKKSSIHTRNNQMITGHYTSPITQIPIGYRQTDIPCIHPAVSSLGACPTPTR